MKAVYRVYVHFVFSIKQMFHILCCIFNLYFFQFLFKNNFWTLQHFHQQSRKCKHKNIHKKVIFSELNQNKIIFLIKRILSIFVDINYSD